MGILPISQGGHIEVIGGSATRTFPHIDQHGLSRYHVIEARADAAPDPYPKTQELMQALADAKGTLSAYLARAGDNPDPAEIARLQEGIEREERAIPLHHQMTRSSTAVGHAFRATRDESLRFLNSTRQSGRKFKGAPADVPRGATYESLAVKIEELGADIRAADEAFPPLDDAIRDARARIESQAARGAPRASVDVEPNGNPMRPVERAVLNLRFPQTPLPAAPLNDGDELITVFDGVAALCWFAKDAVIAKAEADLRAAYVGYDGQLLSEGDRRQRVGELKAQRLTVERQLSALIWSRIDGGDLLICFAAEMAPEAILEIEARN